MKTTDHSHLSALELRLSHEREHMRHEQTESGRKLRQTWIAQIEKEIAAERSFLGLPDENQMPQMSDAELLANLNA